ncbi:hypothetical protein [Anaerovorax odorimutans]|nr:hypothetical protein [Anaerovorax odorimutans]
MNFERLEETMDKLYKDKGEAQRQRDYYNPCASYYNGMVMAANKLGLSVSIEDGKHKIRKVNGHE